MKWQPIDTAPHDDQFVLLWLGNDYMIGRHSGGEYQEWENQSGYQLGFEPTHWMPLPKPPEVP